MRTDGCRLARTGLYIFPELRDLCFVPTNAPAAPRVTESCSALKVTQFGLAEASVTCRPLPRSPTIRRRLSLCLASRALSLRYVPAKREGVATPPPRAGDDLAAGGGDGVN